jgi:hypothetical protein
VASKGSPRINVRLQRNDYDALKEVAMPETISKFVQDAVRRSIREKKRVSDAASYKP